MASLFRSLPAARLSLCLAHGKQTSGSLIRPLRGHLLQREKAHDICGQWENSREQQNVILAFPLGEGGCVII